MKTPLANCSSEAIALREAAISFAYHADTEPEDEYDREGQRLNRALLRAAVKYARAAS